MSTWHLDSAIPRPAARINLRYPGIWFVICANLVRCGSMIRSSSKMARFWCDIAEIATAINDAEGLTVFHIWSKLGMVSQNFILLAIQRNLCAGYEGMSSPTNIARAGLA